MRKYFGGFPKSKANTTKPIIAHKGETMSGLDGYDQWKTASPYDDEPDIIEELEKTLKELNLKESDFTEFESRMHWLISETLEFLDNELGLTPTHKIEGTKAHFDRYIAGDR